MWHCCVVPVGGDAGQFAYVVMYIYVCEAHLCADIVSGIEWETWPTVAGVRCRTADVSLSVGDVVTEV